MIESPTYAPGTPMWVDVSSPDLEGSKAFYGKLFGWEAEESGPEFGGYTMFRSNGKIVAGVAPIMSPDQHPAWTTYVATEDADATVQRAREAGGQVVVEPMTVGEEGRMACFIDPTGAFIGVWQPNRFRGAELVNEPNSFVWNELDTRNIQGAGDFYKKVFGWESETSTMPDGKSYTTWQLNGRAIGGGLEMDERFPADAPPHWETYFAVTDAEATAKKAEELGGQVIVPPTDIGDGYIAILRDPQGAVFGIYGTKQ